MQFYGTPERGYTDSGLWKFLAKCYTKDEHSQQPVKPLMGDDPDYLKIVFLYMLACPKLALPKSRQIRMSWAAVSFVSWFSRTAPYRNTLYQTKKEKDANKMVSYGKKTPAKGRLDFVEHHLPAYLQDYNIVSGSGSNTGSMTYAPLAVGPGGLAVPWYGSCVEAVPQGSDQVRGETTTLYVSDEAAFQEDFKDAMTAIVPAVNGGGRYIALSSVKKGSFFNQLVLEGIDDYHEIRNNIHPAVKRGLDLMGMEWPKGM